MESTQKDFTNALETGYNISTTSLYAVTGMSQAGTNRVSIMVDEGNSTTDHSATIQSCSNNAMLHDMCTSRFEPLRRFLHNANKKQLISS